MSSDTQIGSDGKLAQVAIEGNSPKVAMFVWLEDGTCHQVNLSMSDRRVALDTILRKHDFALKVSEAPIQIAWPKKQAA